MPAVVALLALGVVLALAGCSSGSPRGPSAEPDRAAGRREAAFDAAKTVQLDLSSRDVPPRENGVTAAKGAGVIERHRAEVPGHHHRHHQGAGRHHRRHRDRRDTYLKFFTPDYKKTDLEHAERPEPGDVLRPGDRHLRAAARRPRPEGRRPDPRRHRRCSTKISGTLPGSTVEDLFHLGDGTGTFAVSYGITDSDQLRTATLKGPFFPGVEATYVLVLTDYGAPVEITRP